MNRFRFVLRAGLIVLVLLAGAFLCRERVAVNNAERALAHLRSGVAELATQRDELIATRNNLGESRVASAARNNPTPPARSLATRTAKPTSTSSDATPVRPWLSRLFAEHPQLHALYLKAHREEMELKSAATARRLGLSPEETKRFAAILTADMERVSDIAAATRAQNLSSVDAPIKRLNEERLRERDAALRELLGEERLKQWRQPPPVVAGMTIDRLVLALNNTAEPLTLPQASELEAILAPPEMQPLNFPRGMYVLAKEPTDAVASVALRIERVLTPNQFAAYQALLSAHRATAQIQQRPTRKR